MKKVTVKLNNVFIGITEMTSADIRKAENSGFTVKELVKIK